MVFNASDEAIVKKEFQNEQVKPEKSHSTQWISHLVQSMTGFVFIDKSCNKAMLEGKRRQMVEAEVLLKCSIFIDILDSAKNFSLALQ